MTQKQYEDKLSILETSDAPHELKEKAINELKLKWQQYKPTRAAHIYADALVEGGDIDGID